MKVLAVIILSALLTVSLLGADGFVPLFNGKDLTGWQSPAPYWKVQDGGVLALVGRTDHKMQNKYYLWTEEQHGDFIIDFEFKVEDGSANSGVFIRTEDIQDPVQTGMELQVSNAKPGQEMNSHHVGGLYNLVVPRGGLYKQGWNHYRVTARGSKIKIELNGQVSAEVDLDQYTEAHQNPDGTKNKFRRPLKDFARTGYIGLQDHGTPVWYRNMRIKRLD